MRPCGLPVQSITARLPLDPIERTMYRDINDVTDDDINVYAAVAFKR